MPPVLSVLSCGLWLVLFGSLAWAVCCSSNWLLFTGLNSVSLWILYSKFCSPWLKRKVETPPDFKVLIVGSGMSGICMGKKLNDAGIKYTILEKAENLGGTWNFNSYPGVSCDISSHLYSFSFFLNPRWSREYSSGPEINEYMQNAASRFDVYRHIQFGKEVVSSSWDDSSALWRVQTRDGTSYAANVLISGCGSVHVPLWPSIQGIKNFQGEWFHTAEWDKSFNPAGKRIGVVGTGASAVQAIPKLALMEVSSLTVFQRTPTWSPPRFDFVFPEFIKRMFEMFPFTMKIYRWFLFLRNELFFYLVFTSSYLFTRLTSGILHIMVRHFHHSAVNDKELAEKLLPNYKMGSKRITFSDTYLKTFNKEFVHLVTDKIEEVTARGIRTTESEHALDAIVYATGFDLLASCKPYAQTGLNGSLLAETFGDTPMAFLGISHDQNPNYFLLLGPGTFLGHNTVLYMIECQVDYIVDAMEKLISTKARSMVVKSEVQSEYWQRMQQNMQGKVFADNRSVTGYYRNSRGVNWTLWPLAACSYWWETISCNLENYHIIQ